MSKISVSERVGLLLAQVEILKLKASNGGYDWAHTPDSTKEKLENLLVEIEEIVEIEELTAPKESV